MKESPLVKAIRDAIRDFKFEDMDDSANELQKRLDSAIQAEGAVGFYRLVKED